ncbi:MAG: NAD-dependent epimerase/dehydratase family protein [Phycisphaerales bacterium]
MLRLPTEFVQRLRPAFEGRRVCVTGGCGFIGGHLVDALFGLGAAVTVIDDLSNSSAQNVADLAELDPDRVRFIHASILDDRALDEAMRACTTTPVATAYGSVQYVFHLAAMSSVPRSIAEPERSLEVNAIGTMRVAHASKNAGVRRVVYSASSSAYGDLDSAGADAGRRPKLESMPPAPLSPYAVGKLAGEHIMRAWSASYGLSTVCLRYFNIFGPRQPADSPYAAVIAIFAKKLLSGESPTIFGDGSQSRDFTYVSNAVLANLLAAASPQSLAGEVVNIGSGHAISLNELYHLVARLCGTPHTEAVYQPARVGDVKHSLADISAASSLLGYRCITALESGLEETLAWYREVYADQR